jgi:hypothetical protein
MPWSLLVHVEKRWCSFIGSVPRLATTRRFAGQTSQRCRVMTRQQMPRMPHKCDTTAAMLCDPQLVRVKNSGLR